MQDCDVLLEKRTTASLPNSTEALLESQIPIVIEESINLREASDDFQRKLIRQALVKHQGNWSAAAKMLEMDRANLTRLAKRLGVQIQKVVQ